MPTLELLDLLKSHLTAGTPATGDKTVFYDSSLDALRSYDPSTVGSSVGGVFDVKAQFGAVGNGTTNDATAFHNALLAAVAVGGGAIIVPKGDYLISSNVSIDLAATVIKIVGYGGCSNIRVSTGPGVNGFTFSNPSETFIIEDLVFTGNTGVYEDAGNVIAISSSSVISKVVLNRVSFYGLRTPNGAILSVTGGTLFLRDSKFLGCGADSGVGTSIVHLANWRGCVISGVDFFDYGSLNGVYYSKTGVSPGLAWIYIGEPASSTFSGSEQTGIIVEDCRFDEGIANAAILAPTNRAVTGNFIHSLAVSRCAFNVNNLGGAGIITQNVNHIDILDSVFGWASASQAVMVSAKDAISLLLHNVDYGTAFSGDIWIETPTYNATTLTIDNARFHNLVAASTICLRWPGYRKIYNRVIAAGTYSMASLEPIPIGTFTDGDTSPSVRLSDRFTATNTNPTTITNFDDGSDGQRIVIVCTDGNTTIAQNSNIKNQSGANINPSANTSRAYENYSGVWYEQ